MNSMIYIRGDASDYDRWAALGCTGWGLADVLPLFQKSERNLLGQSPVLHGTQGELVVDHGARDPNPLSRLFVSGRKSSASVTAMTSMAASWKAAVSTT